MYVAKWDPSGRLLITGNESGFLCYIQGTPIKTIVVSGRNSHLFNDVHEHDFLLSFRWSLISLLNSSFACGEGACRLPSRSLWERSVA